MLEKINSLGYENNILMFPQGLAGGLALLWKQDIHLEVLHSIQNYIDARMTYEQKRFHTTFIYGDTDRIKRRSMWNHLIEVADIREIPWFLPGDFNDIINNEEKQDGPM